MLKHLKILGLVLVLSACSTIPGGPSILVLPGTGKEFAKFQNDDLLCRQSVLAQFTHSTIKPESRDEGQQWYDIGYIQCMYGKGHRVPVPGDVMYDTRQEWHPPPPPNMPPPPQSTQPEPPTTPSM